MQREEMNISIKGECLWVQLKCEIDSHTVGRIRERIDREIFLHRPETLVLDFTEVSFMDSSGLALILGRVQLMQSIDGAVKLSGLSEQNLKLVRLCGMQKIKGLSLK